MGTPSREDMISAFELHHRGDFGGAERAYRRILADFPDDVVTHHLLGLVVHQQGRDDEAAELVLEAIAGEPLQPLYRKTLGDIFRAQGDYNRAADCYHRVRSLDPGCADALEGLGEISRLRGDIDSALEWFQKAVELNPGRAEIYFLLGKCFKGKGQLDAAGACYQAGLTLDPHNAEGHGLLGEVLAAQHRLDEAIACFRQALTLKPELPAILNNLGNALKDQGRIEESFQSYREALRLAPGHADIHRNFASALAAMDSFKEAIGELDIATTLRPDFPEAHTNKAHLLLLLGDFERGWKEYQWRFKVKDPLQPVDPREFVQPLWDGSELHGKRILVEAEQGAGDMIQFCRYLAPLKRKGGTVIFECPSRLYRLLSPVQGADIIVPRLAVPPVQFDVHVPLMSLPGLLGHPMNFQPIPIPYLNAPSEFENLATSVVRGEKFKIGICWQGNPRYKCDAERSVALSQFLPFMRIPGVRVFSLQKGFGSEQLASLPADVNVTDLGSVVDGGHDAFVETAAVLGHLDLIITTDTALPHLAGALGRPVWLVVSRVPEWRWQLDGDKSLWYPTMRIFRQDAPGDWAGAFAKVTLALNSLLEEQNYQRLPGRVAG